MLTFEDDGSITIDFPDGPVRVKPPTFGGLKRLKADRVRFARTAQDAMLAWEEANPAPDAEDAVATSRWAEDRIMATDDAHLAAAVSWWSEVLLGDESFKTLVESGSVPPDPDEWPAGLLYDFKPPLPALQGDAKYTTDQLLSLQSMPDQALRHWGNGRCRSGSTTSAASNSTAP